MDFTTPSRDLQVPMHQAAVCGAAHSLEPGRAIKTGDWEGTGAMGLGP